MSNHIPDAGKMACPFCGHELERGVNMYACGSIVGGNRSLMCVESEPIWRELTTLRTANAALVEEVDRLQAWKDSWIDIESKWDASAIAVMLGGKTGESTRAVIAREVPRLVERVKALKAVAEDPHALWTNWLRGDVKLPVGIGDIRQSEEKASRYRERWLSWRKTALEQEKRVERLQDECRIALIRAERAEERVKRLEEAGDALFDIAGKIGHGLFVTEKKDAWINAKATS